MIIVEHRKNTIAELLQVPVNHGVEIDLRLYQGQLVLAHDPFVPGECFDEWIENFQHSLLIINVKESGLEEVILECIHSANIKNYFFLDQPIPSVVKSIERGQATSARISEFENFAWRSDFSPEWIWIDCFSGNWEYLDQTLENIITLKRKTCIVSPELQGRFELFELQNLRKIFSHHKFSPDAVCTKEPSRWVG